MSNARKNFGLCHAGASVVDARGVDDHDALSANLGLNDVDIAGARVNVSADLLLVRSDEVDELFGSGRLASQTP